ncbi:MAG: SpoIVB peptidase [Clostridia bacterium]|nr:SpoIVB peptidase [Clostridia bacterium]
MGKAFRLILILLFSLSCSWAWAAPQIIPGGQAVGVVINQEGLLVLKTLEITNQQGQKINPAQEAGLKPGDLILSLNGISVQKQAQISEILRQNPGEAVEIRFKRQNQEKILSLIPVYSAQSRQYKLGLTVREGVSGIGTLSFYCPANNYYGALGHMVNDFQTGNKIEINQGQIYGALIKGINQAQKGKPGEKIGCLEDNSSLQGQVEKNTPYGIFGCLKQIPDNFYFANPLPVAEISQIKTGPAEMLTVLTGNKVEKFTVEIKQKQTDAQARDLIIKITDPRLLKQCGGIIQGMSGSPIIQNNLFIGAVTHVLINDPIRGYAVTGEKMLEAAEITA